MGSQTKKNDNNNTGEASWMVPIEIILGTIAHKEVQAGSISKVPDKICKSNESAYTPQVVSIGPYHRGSNSDLMLMEQNKWIYLWSVLDRSQKKRNHDERKWEKRDILRECGISMEEINYLVRASYRGNIQPEPHELAETMLVDGCFLLELLLRLFSHNSGHVITNDDLFESQDKISSVLRDLLLLENQVPFIVLKLLYGKLFSQPKQDHRDAETLEKDHRVAETLPKDDPVAKLALKALGYPFVFPTSGVAHLLHLVHFSMTNQGEGHHRKQACQELKRCTRRLQAEGITIKTQDGITECNFCLTINFKDSVLEISPLHIKQETEVQWRNLIAWEQSKTGNSCKFTSYALFFQGLICCAHDIKLLEKVGVIVNDAKKSKEDLMKLFTTMSKGVEHMDSSYTQDCDKLNKYSGELQLKKWPLLTWHLYMYVCDQVILYYWKNWYRILIKDHIPTVWRLVGVLAAIVLLGLTIAQTYYAAHSS